MEEDRSRVLPATERVLHTVLDAQERAERGGFRFDIDIALRGFGRLATLAARSNAPIPHIFFGGTLSIV